jgi:predicted PurR-regulated permease PerM
MNQRPDVMRYVLAVTVVAVLLALSGWVLLPFMAAGVWSVLVVVATWPVLLKLQKWFGGRRLPAVAVMTIAILLLLAIPASLLVSAVIRHSDTLVELGTGLSIGDLPSAPFWLNDLPWVGARLVQLWNGLAASGVVAVAQEYVLPHLSSAGQWLFDQATSVGGVLIDFLMMTLLSALMYARGEQAASMAKQLGQRLGGQRGEAAIVLTGQAIRSVALGVGVTALAQTLLGTIGLALAGIPYPILLGALMLVLCVAQIGPSPVLVPAVIWLFWTGESLGWAIFLAIWSLVVITMDNVLRPWLIRRGADLPLMLILIGVIGGLLTFGLIGIFIGPVVLAVTYTLMTAWLNESLVQESSDPDLVSHQKDSGETQK